MERVLEKTLFGSRWLMAPMYLGLVGGMLVLVYRFLTDCWAMVMAAPGLSQTDVILGILALIDLTLAANLLMIVMFSGYENFVSKLDVKDHEDIPEWLARWISPPSS